MAHPLLEMLPPELVSLGLLCLNYAMFLGGLLIKFPQIIAILRTQTVKGMSEASFTVEFLACLSLCVYNTLMGHPFKTWGEMSLIGGPGMLTRKTRGETQTKKRQAKCESQLIVW